MIGCGFNGKIFSDHRKVFPKSQDIEFFKKFSKNRWTIEWENGVDLAPEYLCKLAKKRIKVPNKDS